MVEQIRQAPWDILGVAPDADIATIRRAYAQKLRVTRPDEDPAGFQRLVMARDFLVLYADKIVADATVQDRPDQDVPLQAGPKPESEAAAPQPPPPAQPDPDATPVPPLPPIFDLPPAAAQAAAPAAPEQRAVDPLPAPPAQTPPPPGSVQPPKPLALVALETLAQELANFRNLGAKIDVTAVEAALQAIPAGEARLIEDHVIRELASALYDERRIGQSSPAHDTLARLALLCVDFFGWHESDRPVYRVLPPQAANEFCAYLSAVMRQLEPKRQGYRPGAPAAPPLPPVPVKKKGGFNPGMWLVFVVVMGLIRLAVNNSSSSKPNYDFSSGPYSSSGYGSTTPKIMVPGSRVPGQPTMPPSEAGRELQAMQAVDRVKLAQFGWRGSTGCERMARSPRGAWTASMEFPKRDRLNWLISKVAVPASPLEAAYEVEMFELFDRLTEDKRAADFVVFAANHRVRMIAAGYASSGVAAKIDRLSRCAQETAASGPAAAPAPAPATPAPARTSALDTAMAARVARLTLDPRADVAGVRDALNAAAPADQLDYIRAVYARYTGAGKRAAYGELVGFVGQSPQLTRKEGIQWAINSNRLDEIGWATAMGNRSAASQCRRVGLTGRFFSKEVEDQRRQRLSTLFGSLGAQPWNEPVYEVEMFEMADWLRDQRRGNEMSVLVASHKVKGLTANPPLSAELNTKLTKFATCATEPMPVAGQAAAAAARPVQTVPVTTQAAPQPRPAARPLDPAGMPPPPVLDAP
jgi:hypothetical protein